MRRMFAVLAVAATLLSGSLASAQEMKPTIVLVHGAFAESYSWNNVIEVLQGRGYATIAVANPLRSVSGDAAVVASVLSSIHAPVVLVGHSYGGSVISAAANGHDNVTALVFVGAFAPDLGETAFGLSGKFPGSTLGAALDVPVALPDGGMDLYVKPDRFHDQFAADVSEAEANLMAATQRPIAEAAGNEPSPAPAWKKIPAWFVYGDQDRNIPPAALDFMAERANSQETVVIAGASHVVMVSNPESVAALIERAAEAK